MVLSFFWYVLAFIPARLVYAVVEELPAINTYLIFCLVVVFLSGPFTAAVYSMVHSMLQGETVAPLEYFTRFRKHYRTSVKLTLALVIIFVILRVDLQFFLTNDIPWMQYVSVVWIYLTLFWLLMIQYVYPVMVRKERSLLDTLKVSALLALDNIVVSLMVFVTGLLVLFLCILTQIPALLFMAGTLSFLHVTALNTIITKYGRGEAQDADDASDRQVESTPDGGDSTGGENR